MIVIFSLFLYLLPRTPKSSILDLKFLTFTFFNICSLFIFIVGEFVTSNADDSFLFTNRPKKLTVLNDTENKVFHVVRFVLH